MSPDLHTHLLRWYDSRTREMPWRNHPDPYAVWISEIMLQQTQVETVKGFFLRFVEQFPTVAALAAAPQEAVLKAWEGLGYYTRARNLQKAAQQLVQTGNTLPSTAEAWNQLPGIGAYTAAAIASICFGEMCPVVDGNVARVFARYLTWPDDFRKPAAREKLAQWLRPLIVASKRPGDFNQAMMDLGATCCTPRTPNCPACPLQATCRAYTHDTVATYPVKPLKKKIPHRVYIAFLAQDDAHQVLLTQRTTTALLHGLWELPNHELNAGPLPSQVKRCQLFHTLTGLTTKKTERMRTISHLFSHFKQTVYCYRVPHWTGALVAAPATPLRFAAATLLPLTTVARRAIALRGDPRSESDVMNGHSCAKTRKSQTGTRSLKSTQTPA